MSIESGRKLGLTSSLIFVIGPIIALVLDGLLFFSLFLGFSSTVTNGGRIIGYPFPVVGLTWIGLIGVSLVSLIGFITFIVAMYQLSHYYDEPGIFKNIIYAVVVSIVGAVVLALLLVALLVFRIGMPTTSAPEPGLFILGLLSIIGAFFVVVLFSCLLFKRAFNNLAAKSGVQSFDTAGLLIVLGVIIPFVSWIGWIFAVSGFNSLKPKPAENSSIYNTTTMVQATTPQNKYCPQCGTANGFDAAYCKYCGKKLQ